MANPWFRFKQFQIRQDGPGFKVGTDGVLLGAWADITGVNAILDVGTGTGLLALMLAQRCKAKLIALEISKPSYEQAIENVNASPWKDRITILHCPVQDFMAEQKFDLIISNPPFFHDSYKPTDKNKIISRHDDTLSLEELAMAAIRNLNAKGKLCLVLPLEESRDFERISFEKGLFLHRVLEIRPTPRHSIKRRLMEFRLCQAQSVIHEDLTIEYGKRHDYTDQYRDMCKDFYLAF
ncbi:tRNA1(Val) (adenine(37)-N6)-methyltransferase [Bacteroidota bacterium]